MSNILEKIIYTLPFVFMAMVAGETIGRQIIDEVIWLIQYEKKERRKNGKFI